MRTFPIRDDAGQLRGFEVSNLWLGPRTVAKIMRGHGAEITYLRRPLRRGAVHLKFRFASHEFQLIEPFGDSSRYWIVPVDPDVRIETTVASLEGLLQSFRATPLRVVGSLVRG